MIRTILIIFIILWFLGYFGFGLVTGLFKLILVILIVGLLLDLIVGPRRWW